MTSVMRTGTTFAPAARKSSDRLGLRAYLPAGWADVATKQDVEMLRLELAASLAGFSDRFTESCDRLAARFERELRLQTWRFITVMITLCAGLFAGLGALTAVVR